MKFLHIAILIVILLFVACTLLVASTRPYPQPVAEHPVDRVGDIEDEIVFDGVKDVMETFTNSEDGKLRMIFTHGMCSHNHGSESPQEHQNALDKIFNALLGIKQQELEWAQRRSNALSDALGIDRTDVKKGKIYKVNNEMIVSTKMATYDTNEGEIEAHFLIWGHAVDKSRAKLKYENYQEGYEPVDKKGMPKYNSPKRAYLNNRLRKEFVNSCLMDPVVYLGQRGNDIRQGMKQAVCDAFGGQINDDSKVCHNRDNNKDPIVLVSESLGSVIFVDAVATLIEEFKKPSTEKNQPVHRCDTWTPPSIASQYSDSPWSFDWNPFLGLSWDARCTSFVEEHFFNISSIFLDTNQIPLLHQAKATDSFGYLLNEAREHREGRAKEKSMKNIQVIAISDPNDLLSYRLTHDHFNLHPDGFQLYNVLISNAGTYLGIIENPLKAHNPDPADVFSIIVEGSKVVKSAK